MQFQPRNPEFAGKVRETIEGQAFMSLIGGEIVHLVPGEVDIAWDHRPDLTQQHGYIHAGVTTTAADTSAGLAALSLFEPGAEVLTTEFKLNLVAPAVGERFVARGRVIKPGRTLTTCKSDVFAVAGDKETLIATGLFTMMQMKP